MRILIAAASVLAVMSVAAPKVAHAAPFCIVEGGDAAYESCAFATMEQCRASAEGSRAGCFPNPREMAERPPTQSVASVLPAPDSKRKKK